MKNAFIFGLFLFTLLFSLNPPARASSNVTLHGLDEPTEISEDAATRGDTVPQQSANQRSIAPSPAWDIPDCKDPSQRQGIRALNKNAEILNLVQSIIDSCHELKLIKKFGVNYSPEDQSDVGPYDRAVNRLKFHIFAARQSLNIEASRLGLEKLHGIEDAPCRDIIGYQAKLLIDRYTFMEGRDYKTECSAPPLAEKNIAFPKK